MTQDYKTYLAVNVLNEGRIITYRSLSRALKVHVNAAKKMLYDFHHQQTARKPGSVHGIYLISGMKKVEPAVAVNGGHTRDGEDSFMQSSPFMSSSMPQDENIPSRKVVTLVREEQLEVAKNSYESISTIHLYSLGPCYLQNIQLLSDCTRELMVTGMTEDALVTGKIYGAIQNPRVKRRTVTKPPLLPAQSVPKTESKPGTKLLPKPAAPGPSSLKHVASAEDSKPEPIKTQDKISNPNSKSVAKPSKLSREQSDIFKSFGKTKKPVLKKSESSTSNSLHATDEDEPMKDASEDEQLEDFVVQSKPAVPNIQRKNEREETLRKMMEDDSDEDMEPKTETEPVDDEAISKAEDITAETEAAPAVAPAPGQRRRGRRKVMKRRTIKDEEGYLVTKEEASWESFSEDEPTSIPAPAPAKAKPALAGISSTAKGGKKGAAGGKPGQGNIMSFFGKKP